MELSLPQKQSTEKKYKHFIVETHPTRETAQLKRIDFFYVGTNSFKIDFLVNSFEGGYALENIDIAIPFLKRNAEKHTAPDVIIIDGKTSEISLRKFQAFLSSVPGYQNVPVIMDGSELTEEEVSRLQSIHFIDEIIFLDRITRAKLVAKANFLKKIKSRQDTTALKNLEFSTLPKYTFSLFLKRVFDIMASSIALLLLAPIFIVIAILIKLESKGSIFYIAPRAGKGYKIFKFYKFRTMVAGADKKVQQLSHLNQYAPADSGPVFFKISNDPRITKIGAFLRNTSLDEIPQLLNVFLGDMSLVGNRPLPLYEAATLTTDHHAARFMAPAGITGLWQIKKRGDSNMSVEERISLDIVYARKFSFVYDLWIIANTPVALLQKENV